MKPLICSFESRRAPEMRSLIERFGGEPFVAPSMKEVPLEQNAQAITAIKKVVSGDVTHMVLLTGVGTEAMLKIAASQQMEEGLLEAMKQIPLLVRGPKPAAVLKRVGLSYTVKAPAPNTWNELLAAMNNANIDLEGQVVAVQEYGAPNPELCADLSERGATVIPIPVYRWAMPDDTGPLKEAVCRTISNDFQALLFTSAQQVRNVLTVADELQQRDVWLGATRKTVVASIGPTCSEALRVEGLEVHVEASPPKMGPLVRSALAVVDG